MDNQKKQPCPKNSREVRLGCEISIIDKITTGRFLPIMLHQKRITTLKHHRLLGQKMG